MRFRFRIVTIAAGCIILLLVHGVRSGARAAAVYSVSCGAPVAAGTFAEPPQIDVATLPRDDRGLHEMVLRVGRDRDRFCFEYRLNGSDQTQAPVLRAQRGERFAVRIVNELSGPARGAAMPASELARCMPAAMAMATPRQFAGYFNHTIYARSMRMSDVDVNLHLHGFEGPPQQENVFLSTLSTPMHACEYDITIPLTQPPGTYFYHPHAHGMAGDEVAGGLAGMWIVDADKPQLPRDDEHAVILRYRVPFVTDNNFLPHTGALEMASAFHEAQQRTGAPIAFNPFAPPPWPSAIAARAKSEALAGSCGNRPGAALAVNGVDAPARLTVPAGEPQLLRLLNATSDSVEFLHLRDAAGAMQTMRVVARDGVPVGPDAEHPLSRYVATREAQLIPTARMDVLLTLKAGDVLTLYGDHHCIAPIDEFHISHDVLTIAAGPAAANPTAIATAPLEQNESPAVRLMRFARTHPRLVRRRAITYSEYALPDGKGRRIHPEYYITQTSVKTFHEQPYWPQYRKGADVPQADIVVKHGTIEEWYLFNTTLEEHSFHIHQMAFVAEDGKPGPAMLDTVLVPVGTLLPNKSEPDYPLVKPSVTHVLLDFRNVPRGTFVFHCHMLFHEDHGMMAVIRVE